VLKDPAAAPRKSALTQFESGYSLRTARYRYTQWGPDGRDGAELYDHQSDPEEMVNLASQPERADTVKRLASQLQERIAAATRVPLGLKQVRD
jgi:arylsulfatase A-like enzyme